MTAPLPREGRLYGVGVGPGDPELLTVRATKILASTRVVAYFAKKETRGIARAIVARWLPEHAHELPLFYPLTTEVPFCDPVYEAELRTFYDDATGTIAEHLCKGHDVALICEGDPLLYGSFMHLYVRLKGRFDIEIVPGISGMSGCWSAAKVPIAWGTEVLSVVPGTLGSAALARHIAEADAVVIIKVGSNLGKIRAAIAAAGRMETAIYVEHGTGEAEKILPLEDMAGEDAPYFSIVLVPGRGRHL